MSLQSDFSRSSFWGRRMRPNCCTTPRWKFPSWWATLMLLFEYLISNCRLIIIIWVIWYDVSNNLLAHLNLLQSNKAAIWVFVRIHFQNFLLLVRNAVSGWLRPAGGDGAGPPARLETLEQPRAVELESLGAGEPNSLSYGVVELYLVYRATWTQVTR